MPDVDYDTLLERARGDREATFQVIRDIGLVFVIEEGSFWVKLEDRFPEDLRSGQTGWQDTKYYEAAKSFFGEIEEVADNGWIQATVYYYDYFGFDLEVVMAGSTVGHWYLKAFDRRDTVLPEGDEVAQNVIEIGGDDE